MTQLFLLNIRNYPGSAMTLNNPAGRLYNVLGEAAKIPPNTRIDAAWAGILGLKGASRSELLAAIAPVYKLPALAQEAVRRNAHVLNVEMCLRWVPAIEKSFGIMNFEQHWEDFRRALNPDVLLSLELCADNLDRFATDREPVADVDALAAISSEFEALERDVAKAEIDQVLKAFLLSQILTIRKAIQDFRFNGIEGVRQALAAAAGRLALDPHVRDKAAKEPLAGQFWTLIVKASNVTSLVVNLLKITGGVEAPLLLAPPPIIDVAPAEPRSSPSLPSAEAQPEVV